MEKRYDPVKGHILLHSIEEARLPYGRPRHLWGLPLRLMWLSGVLVMRGWRLVVVVCLEGASQEKARQER